MVPPKTGFFFSLRIYFLLKAILPYTGQNRALRRAKNLKNGIFTLWRNWLPVGGVLTPKSCPNFLFWTSLTSQRSMIVHVYTLTGIWAVSRVYTVYTYRVYTVSDDVSKVKKSIFQLWSGIVLGWSEWPKNG